jgi:RND family efflux transporter MFP subunit
MGLSGLRLLSIAASIVALLSTSCMPMLSIPGQTAAASTSSATQASANVTSTGTSTIRIGKAVRGDLSGVIIFAAPIQAKGEVAIIPRVSTTLNKLDVDVGSHVRVGDTLAQLDHAALDEQVLTAQAAQASAEARLAELKAGPKSEVVAAAQANYNAAQARVKSLQSARDNADLPTLDQRVKDAQTALDQAQAAMQPNTQAIAQADAAAQAAQSKLAQLQADPVKSKDQAAMDAAKADVQKANDATTRARVPTGSQAAVNSAQRDLQDAQQAQLLARLSTTAFDLDQAKALADVADAQLKLANAPSSPEEMQAAQASVEQTFALAELARARVRDATITTPITGIVTDIKAAVGSTVGPSAAIMTLIPPELQVIVHVDESQLAQVQTGQSANLSVETFPRDAFTGTVKAIAPVLDPRTRSASVEIDISDPQGKLKPGMFAQLAIQVGQRQSALLVPKEAVLKVGSVDPTAPAQNVVYTIADGRVHKQIVNIGASDGRSIEILQGGVQEGMDLVLNPRPDFLEGELISAT